MFRPLRITATLGTPIVGDPCLPLDGILLSASMAAKYGEWGVSLPGELPPVDYDVVPIQRIEHGDDWFFACSFAAWDTHIEGTDHWNKRLDTQYAELIAGGHKVNEGSGKYKAYHSRIFYRHAHRITWELIGDPDAILRLLPLRIGKKTAMGWGKINRWSIDPIEAFTLITDEGVPTRAVPESYMRDWISTHGVFSLDTAYAYRAVRPPYWHTDNVTMVAIAAGVL